MRDSDLRQLIVDVLEKGYLMSLGTHDSGGVWVADVIYIFDEELNLYWMSDPEVRHSSAIVKQPQVAGTITVSQAAEPNLGLQFSGKAAAIDGARYDLAVKHLAKRHKLKPAETDDVLDGDKWYQLTPEFIELIDEKDFGYEKQKMIIDR